MRRGRQNHLKAERQIEAERQIDWQLKNLDRKEKPQFVAQFKPKCVKTLFLFFFGLSLCDELIRFPQK